MGDSFVAPLVEISGEVYIGRHSFVTNHTILRAEPEQHICIGGRTNVQDNAWVSAHHEVSHIGDESSLAHHGIVRDSQLGDFVFIGFNAQVRNSVIEDGVFILHGAYVEGVTVPKDRLVGVGQVVLTQEVADALPVAPRTTEEF
ncbi:MAG: carbonate dehydratase, partial [Chloroflexota bacterium]|nr:carbonate dehydratase [Chloroflexota bacterium]